MSKSKLLLLWEKLGKILKKIKVNNTKRKRTVRKLNLIEGLKNPYEQRNFNSLEEAVDFINSIESINVLTILPLPLNKVSVVYKN